jgi:hypothetical protein
MNTNEFVYWLKGIVDSTQFIPTKKTWDLIEDTLKEVKLDKKKNTPRDEAVTTRLKNLGVEMPPQMPTPPNPYEVKCEK